MTKVKLHGTDRLEDLRENGTMTPRTCHVLRGEGLETMQDVWDMTRATLRFMRLVPNCGRVTDADIHTLYSKRAVIPVYLRSPYFKSPLYHKERALVESYAAGVPVKKLAAVRGTSLTVIYRIIKRWRVKGGVGHPMYEGVLRP